LKIETLICFLISLGVDLGFSFHPLAVFMVILAFDLSIWTQAVKGVIIEEETQLSHFLYFNLNSFFLFLVLMM